MYFLKGATRPFNSLVKFNTSTTKTNLRIIDKLIFLFLVNQILENSIQLFFLWLHRIQSITKVKFTKSRGIFL